ncbi:hypothetical protein Hanom_Chr02g00109861 [Helianthus anomalus]
MVEKSSLEKLRWGTEVHINLHLDDKTLVRIASFKPTKERILRIRSSGNTLNLSILILSRPQSILKTKKRKQEISTELYFPLTITPLQSNLKCWKRQISIT